MVTKWLWRPIALHQASLAARVLETWVWSPGWQDPLEEGMVTHCSTLAWRIPMDRGAWWAAVRGVAELDTAAGLNTCPTQGNLQIHCNPYQITDVIYSYN